MCLFGTPIAWKSKRQTVRAHSTCDAEYTALPDGIQWAEAWGHLTFFVWNYRNSDIFEGGLPHDALIWTDSLSARDVAVSEMNKPKARWMALKWYKVKEFQRPLHFCVTSLQKADALTKPPNRQAIRSILSEQGMRPLRDLP